MKKPNKKYNLQKRIRDIHYSLKKRGGGDIPSIEKLTEEINFAVKQICYYCGVALSPETFSCDHIKPIERGGDSSLCNLWFQICRRCNTAKSIFSSSAFRDIMEQARKHKIHNLLVSKLILGARCVSERKGGYGR